MNYSELVGKVKEVNRPSGGLNSIVEVLQKIKINDADHILEVGCNNGFTAINLALLTNCKVIGIDKNKTSISNSKILSNKFKVHSNCRFYNMDVTKMDFRKNKFKLIWLSNVLSFVSNEEKAIKECFRVLVNKGYLIIIPIYYFSEPPLGVIEKLKILINKNFEVRYLSYWLTLIENYTNKLNYCYEIISQTEYKFIDVSERIPNYVLSVLKKSDLNNLGPNEFNSLIKEYTEALNLFNENLKYCKFSIIIIQKRVHAFEEKELFESSISK